VTQAVPLKPIGGQASLGVRFTDLVLPTGETIPIKASLLREGRNESKRAAATIGGAAAGGAILGNILSRGNRGGGSVIGALIGAVAGTAIAAHHKGQEMEIPQGTVLGLQLDQAVEVRSRQ
jgi:outer membrane lipoprotein SlyB